MASSEWRTKNPQPATHNPILRFAHYALRFQLTTLNGTWDKGHGTKQQRLANGEQKTLKPSTRDPQPIFTLHASRFTLNLQLATRNPQLIFGANAPPTCHFHALRITLLLVPFRDVIFVTVNSKMAKMAGK